LKASHFYLGLDENYGKIEHSHSILSKILGSYRVYSEFPKPAYENSNETL